MIKPSTIDGITKDYLATALWSSHNYDSETDETVSEHFDGDYDIEDIDDDSYLVAQCDVEKFVAALEAEPADGYDNLYEAAVDVQPLDHLGHNLFLTRVGHGCGYWDGDYAEYGDDITNVVHAVFGEYSQQNLFAQNGKVSIE